jgi:hypothetical protein
VNPEDRDEHPEDRDEHPETAAPGAGHPGIL